MSILFRYVLRSFAVPATLCLVGLSALTLLFMSFDLISACFDPKANVTWQVAFDFMSGMLSMYLEWLLPAIFLLATLYTMWQLCRNSELIAMRASGIGMGTVVAPILLTAFVAAAFSFVNTEFLKPVAATRALVIKNSDFRETGREPRRGIGFQAPDGSHRWIIGEMDPRDPELLRDVKLTFFREDTSMAQMYEAPEARWLDGAWTLMKGVKIHYYNTLSEPELPGDRPDSLPTKTFYEQQVPEHPREILVQNGREELASAQDRKMQRKLRDQAEGGLTRRQKNADSYNTYNHYAAPFAILLVTFFAIPAGIASGRQSVFRGILVALSLFLSYYAITALAMFLATNDFLKPALAVALPSLIFGVAAIVMFRRLP